MDVPDSLFDRPNHTTIKDADLFAWWAMSVERAYKVAKTRARAHLHGRYTPTFDKYDEDAFSAAVGRVKAFEALFPELFTLWVHDADPRRKDNPEDWSHARLIRETAEQDARDEFRNEILLGALATGEVLAPEQAAA